MKAVIVIRGGCLTAVYSDNPELEVVLVDHDDLASLIHQSEDDETKAAEGLTAIY